MIRTDSFHLTGYAGTADGMSVQEALIMDLKRRAKYEGLKLENDL